MSSHPFNRRDKFISISRTLQSGRKLNEGDEEKRRAESDKAKYKRSNQVRNNNEDILEKNTQLHRCC